MTFVKINNTQYPAKITGYSRDLNWGDRASKHITLEMEHAEAETLFVDGLVWSQVNERGSYVNKDGETVTPEPVEIDMSTYDVAGAITDNRDGTVTVKMGKSTPSEVLTILTGIETATMQLAPARAVRTVMETAAESLDDQTVSKAPQLLRPMRGDGQLIQAGARIQWNGAVKRAACDLWDNEENSPDNAPALWEDIGYKAGIRIIPQTITAGLSFAQGEQGWWNDVLYTSRVDTNVYTPEQYPENWEAV